MSTSRSAKRNWGENLKKAREAKKSRLSDEHLKETVAEKNIEIERLQKELTTWKTKFEEKNSDVRF